MFLFGNEKKLVLLLQECFAHCGVRVVLFYEEKLPKVTPQKEEWLVRGYCFSANCNARRLWAPHVGLCLSFFLLPNSADFPPSPERLTFLIKAIVQSGSFDRFDLWRVKTEVGAYRTAFYKKYQSCIATAFWCRASRPGEAYLPRKSCSAKW